MSTKFHEEASPSARTVATNMATLHQQLHFINRSEWRAWLQENHATAKEAWLVHYKKHANKPGISFEEAVEEALCFGWIDGVLHRIDEEKFALRYSPRKQGSVWSETNKRRVRKLIKQGRMTEAGLAKVSDAKANGEWRAATLREDVKNTPDDLKQALKANSQAQRNFDRLAPSHKRQYIYWITSAKTDKTRQRRIQETVRRMMENRKLISRIS
jgi:uncharacterized protein YdeI (YjbR/CyaY-like superfamily)